MSTTTSSMATLPSMKLRSRPVCDILNQQIIAPVMRNNWSVSAFRMAWTRQMDAQQIWDQIVVMRAELDRLVRLIPGVLFFVSAINATPNQGKAGGETAVLRANPGVMYWLVAPQVVVDQRTLCNHMHSNQCAATLKLALQPYQTTEKDIRNALFGCVKDNMEGCVRRLVEESCAHCYGPTERLREPLVKVYVGKEGPREMVTQAFNDLTSVRFRSEVLDLEIQ